jgi:protease-4
MSNPGYSQPTVVVYTQSAWSRFWSWMGWLAFFIVALIVVGQWVTLAEYFDTTEGIEEKFVQGSKLADDKIAIITVSGVIVEGDGFVKNQIDKVKADKNVKAIVVRVDSPGGTVTGSDYIYHHLTKLREEKSVPVVVSMGGIAASGGYYVAMAVGDQPDTIFAEPTCSTGSIGVMIPHYDISGLLAKLDIEDDSIATHPRKLMLSMTRDMTPEERELITAHINDMFERFKEVIKEGRPMFKEDPSALDQLATGEIFTAEKAQKNKLIDKIGFVEEAINRALELASLDKEKTKVVKYKRPVTLFDNLGYAEARRRASPLGSALDLATLLDFSAPRAWYLTTSLPALVSSRRAD